VKAATAVGEPASKIWIGRSKLFVGQQRPAFAIFDIVKSGVTEEASADVKSNLSVEEHFGNAEEYRSAR